MFSARLICAVALIWRESRHPVMYGSWFLRNVLRSVLVELFLVGVSLDGWRAPWAAVGDDAWVE